MKLTGSIGYSLAMVACAVGDHARTVRIGLFLDEHLKKSNYYFHLQWKYMCDFLKI